VSARELISGSSIGTYKRDRLSFERPEVFFGFFGIEGFV